MRCLCGWVNVQEFFISVEAEGERLGNGKLCVERTEKLGHAWRGSRKNYKVLNAAKTGLWGDTETGFWGGTGVAAQMSSSQNANSSMLHLGVLLQHVSKSKACVLSVLG